MFEKYVERLLNRYLAPYVDGISKDTVDLLKGDVVLRDLTIKKEAFDFLKSSGVLLHTGTIKRINLKIPWRSLTSGKIELEVDAIAVDVGRIQGDIPDEAEILADFRKGKAAQVEKKVAQILELKELSETMKEERKGFGARFAHRMVQNLVVSITQVAVRFVDLKQDLLYGLLLGSLSVKTVTDGPMADDPKNDVGNLRKQIDVRDLAAFCRIEQQPLRYILEPTVLKLRVDHTASELNVKLNLLDDEKETGGILAISKSAMTRAIVAIQELQAWQEHTSSVVAAQCESVKVDAESLKGATKQRYIEMWRKNSMGQIILSNEGQIDFKSPSGVHSDEIRAIEDAVPARHLALWRIEVQKQLKSAEQQALKVSSTRRGGWWPFSVKDAGHAVLSDDDWQDIKKKVEKEQASLAELNDPQTKEFIIELKQFCAHLYEEASDSNAGKKSRRQKLTVQKVSDQGMPAWIQYDVLCEHLNKGDHRSSILHRLSVTVGNLRANVDLRTQIVQNHECTECSFGAVLGMAQVHADNLEVLRYAHQQEAKESSPDKKDKKARLTRQKAQVLSDDISVHLRGQEDGRQLISTTVHSPPVILTVSPSALKLAIDLISFDLPPPPVFSKTAFDHEESAAVLDLPKMEIDEAASSVQVGATAENHAEATRKPEFSRVSIDHDPEIIHIESAQQRKSTARKTVHTPSANISDWKEEEQERILETIHHEIERAKEGTLCLELDISIAAPQVTIVVDEYREISIDLGCFSCVSDDVMTVDDFNVRLDLKHTQIMCTYDEPGQETHIFPVLEPISLSVVLKGEPSSEEAENGSRAKQKVTADLMLEELVLKVYPISSHMFLRLPEVYSMLLSTADNTADEQEQGLGEDETSWSLSRLRFASDDDNGLHESEDVSPASTSVRRLSQTSQQPASTAPGTSPVEEFWAIHASLAIELVRLGVFDMNGNEVARTDLVELTGDAKSGLTEISSIMRLRHILVEVGGQPLVYMKDGITRMDERTPDQTPDGDRSSENGKAFSGIDAKLSIPLKNTDTSPMTTYVEICPIVISWRKQTVGALYAVVMSCVGPASSNVQKHEPTRHSVHRRDTVDSVVIKARPSSIGSEADCKETSSKEESKALAASGLVADAALPALQSQTSDKTLGGRMAVDILFGGLTIDLHVSQEEEMQLSPAWKGFRDAPLIHFTAIGVQVHYKQYDADESSGHAVLEEVFMEYDGERIIAPWQMDKPLLEFDFCTYNTSGRGDPVYSICLKMLMRQVSAVYFQKHLDSLVFYLQDNILGALVTAAAAQAAEAVQHQVEAKILLWSVSVESPVIYLSRDIDVLHNSPTWELTKCSLPEMPPKDDERHPTPLANTFAQCVVLRPGTIQARCLYELDTWAMRIHLDFKDCGIRVVDSEAYAAGPICDLFHWEMTLRPESPTNQSEPLHCSVGMYFFPLNLSISQAQLILIMNTLSENVAYSRFFPVEAVSAPEGASAAAMPHFAARYYSDESSPDDDESRAGQFESMRMNIRLQFESMQLAVAYSTPGACSSADAQQIPVLQLGGTDFRMTFDAVSYYGGEGMLFSYGFFVDNIYADDLRPETFRSCCHDRVIVCRTESGSYAAPGSSDDSWKLVVDREEGEKPWLPDQVAMQVVFTKTTAEHSIMTLKVKQPRAFCVVQLIMDAVFLVVDGMMESTLTSYASPLLPSGSPNEQAQEENIEQPMVITFNFSIEGLTLYLLTNCQEPAAPLIEVMASLGVEFEFAPDLPMKIHEVDLYDVSISCSEDTGEGECSEEAQIYTASKTRTSVRLVQLSKLTTVGSVGLAPRPELNILVHALPLSVRLSTRDVPYLLAAVESIGEDGAALLSVFSLERRKLATASELSTFDDDQPTSEKDKRLSGLTIATGTTEGQSVAAQHSSISAGSLGKLKLCVIGVSGVNVPGQRVDDDEQTWVTAEFVGHDVRFVLHWGILTEINVPAKQHGLNLFGANKDGLEVSEEGVILQLKLWRGAQRTDPQCLGVLSFPVGLCLGAGLQCRRYMRPTSVEHSILVAREHMLPLELQFEARLQESPSALRERNDILEFSTPTENLEDFLKPMQQLEDFLEVPVPQVPFTSMAPQKTGWHNSQHAARSSSPALADATSSSGTAAALFSARAFLSFDGIEVLFLDDCQAKVLPVLRGFLRAQSKMGSEGAPSESERQILQGALGAEGAGGILVQMNPYEGEVQQKGFSLRVEECTVGLQYLNSRAGCWEPFLEQWSFDLFVDAGKEHAAEEVEAEDSKSFRAALEMRLVSFMPLLVNVTPQLFSLASWLIDNSDTYMAQFFGRDCISGLKPAVVADARYRLLNMTGKPIKVVLFRPRSQEELKLHAELFNNAASRSRCGTDSSSTSESKERTMQSQPSAGSSTSPQSKAGTAALSYNGLRWHEFQPREEEIDLDSLLGNRSAEQWRELADEALSCAIEVADGTVIQVPCLPEMTEMDSGNFDGEEGVDMAPASTMTFTSTSTLSLRRARSTCFGADPDSEAKVAVLSLSSASEGVLPLESNPPGYPMYAACEVLAPHPSHHLLVVSSGLRIFNHTGRAFQIFYRAGDVTLPFGGAADANASQEEGNDRVLAAPFNILPLRTAMPREIASALNIQLGSNRAEGSTMQEFAAEASIAHTYSMKRKVSENPEEEKTADAQWLKPQCFCAAPLEVASITTCIQLGIAESEDRSNPIPVEIEESQQGNRHHEVLIKDNRSTLRFHAYVVHASEHSIAKISSVHIYTPLRLINSTPVKLQFVFEVPKGPTVGAVKRSSDNEDALVAHVKTQRAKRLVVDLEPLTDCDLPPDIDPSQPYGVSLILTDKSGTESEEVRHRSPPVPRIFDSSSATEDLVAVPLDEDESDRKGEGVLMLTVNRGLSCSIACQRWLIDRTNLGLRVIHSLKAPTATSLALPRLDGHTTLLSPIYQKWMRASFPEIKRMQYHLALPLDGKDGWIAVGPAKLPDTSDRITYAALSVQLANAQDVPRSEAITPVHVCLHAEALSLELTFGTPCHIISVLPQVIIYNKIADDGIDVRAMGDPYSEILVESEQSSQFLQWKPHKNPKKMYARSRLMLEFRPRQLKEDAHWSAPIKISSNRCTSESVVFSAAKKDDKLPSMLRMYMVEVAEQDGVVCFTVTRGSRCELRNFSRLVQEVAITPMRPGSQRGVVNEETFVGRLCETVEFAWPSQGSELQLAVELRWAKVAGCGSTECVIPDVYKPAQLVFPTPGGWLAVAVRTGCTNDITWLQVQDLHSIAQLPPSTTFAGTFSRAFGLDTELQSANLAGLKLGVSLSGIGISLVSELHERELAYAEVQQVGLLVGVWDDQWSLEVLISDVQVDCQLLDFKDNPVALANRGEQSLPWLQVKVSQRLPTSRYGISLPLVMVQLDCMEADLNDQFLLDVLNTLSKLSDLVSFSQGVTREQLNVWRERPLAGSFESPPSVPQQVTLDELVFLGLELHLWAKVSLSKLPIALRKPFQLMTAGSDSLCVDGATLRMSPEVFDGIQGAAPRVMRTLMERYYWSFFVSLGSVLGRSSLLELPALPVRWGRRGVSQAMRAVDFLLHRAADVFEILTLDEQYIRRKKREHQQRLRDITGLRSGLSTAALHLGSGLLHIVDIVREPIVGAQSAGLTGFVTGIGRGLLSTMVKPVIEVGFSARAITKAVRVKVKNKRHNKARRVTMRRRPPRVMYGAGGIREYDEAAALLTLEVATAVPVPGCSQKDLIAIEQAKFGITDHIVVEQTGATPYIRHLLLLVTPLQLLLVALDSQGIAVRWAVPLTNFRGARASSHGVLVWEEPTATGEASSPLVGHQVPCSDAAVISKIFWMLQDVQSKGISSGMPPCLETSKKTEKVTETRWEKMRRGLQSLRPFKSGQRLDPTDV